MSFKDFDVKISYKSLGEITISSIINPLLSQTKIYKRSVGFFSSSAFDFLNDGIINLARSGGKIFLITSPKLSEEDIKAINIGYSFKELVKCKFMNEFEKAIEELSDSNLQLVSELIANDILNIKIVSKKNSCGMYHDKLAILYDSKSNRLVFTGSNNESGTAYGINYEKVRVFKSWIDSERVDDEEIEFDEIWNDNNKYLDTYSFNDAIKESIIKLVRNKESNKTSGKSEPYKLHDYQELAINKWNENGKKGFFVMATGTGKTVTALYALKGTLENEEVFTVIAVPYKHLVAQWSEDVEKIIPNAHIIKVYGEIHQWENKIKDAIFSNKFGNKKNIIIISTISSFYSDRFDAINHLIKGKRLLLVDEAHNFLKKIYANKFYIDYEYKIGLSATPVFGKDENKTHDLVKFFGGIVFELPIERAIGKHLVNYYYHPIYVDSTENDEKLFLHYNKLMSQCFDKDGKLIDEQKFTTAYRGRLRSISVAENKMTKLNSLIDEIGDQDHFIIYCSDGKIYDESEENIRHLEKVVLMLNEKGFKPSQFTASETMDDRVRLIDNFNEGRISTLAAIRCLDEGINIPSIKTAIIVSSNDNYREFVQRRGRILRKHKIKTTADIYDFIVLPSIDCVGIAEIELRRFYEYAKLSICKEELLIKLQSLLDKYNLTFDDILFNNEFIDGGDLDD